MAPHLTRSSRLMLPLVEETEQIGDDSDFFVLGAGFSRAVSHKLPLLRDLGAEVLADLGIDASALEPFGGSIEAWLSYLSTDQPWLDGIDTIQNRALFLRASESVARAISGAEVAALADPPAEWLCKLVWEWSWRRASIASFNYDTLIERLCATLWIALSAPDLYALPITERWMAGSGRSMSENEPPGSVPTVFKLHGSTTWYYGGLDAPPGEPIVLHRRHGGSWTDMFEHQQRSPHLHDDLVPLIVPPTGTKNAYYNNRALRTQWATAAHRLVHARTIVVIGYSLPPSDLQVRQFLATNVSCDARVIVVDERPEAADAFEDVLSRRVEKWRGSSAVEDFCGAYTGSVFRSWTDASDQSTLRMTLDGAELDESGASESTTEASVVRDTTAQEIEARWPGAHIGAVIDVLARDAGWQDAQVAYIPRRGSVPTGAVD
jgi:hypothetical protein